MHVPPHMLQARLYCLCSVLFVFQHAGPVRRVPSLRYKTTYYCLLGHQDSGPVCDMAVHGSLLAPQGLSHSFVALIEGFYALQPRLQVFCFWCLVSSGCQRQLSLGLHGAGQL